MGSSSSRPLKSTRAGKARSVKPSPKFRLTRRLATTKRVTHSGIAAIDASRTPRGIDAPTLATIGQELRMSVMYLELVESYVIVCRMALDGQDAGQDSDIGTLLQRAIGDLLFDQMRQLKNVAGRCDGRPLNDDDELEHDDTEVSQP